MSHSLDSLPVNPLRRTRSASDIPRLPEPIHRSHSQRHSGVEDHLEPSLGPHSHRRNLSRIEDGRRSPPLAVPLEYPQTHTLGGHGTNYEDEEPPSTRPQSLYGRVRFALGFGRGASRERKSLVGLSFNLVSGASQIVVITVILALSGTQYKSPTASELTEWEACSRPLGAWACIWVIRAALACSLNYWGFLRERVMLAQRRLELAASVARGGSPRISLSAPARNEPSSRVPHVPENHDFTLADGASLPYTLLYSRLTLLSSLLTLSWFLTAHILEYTSVNTCRHSSPHIWWLTFGILCLMYVMVLEVVVLGFVVFVVAPILFLFWNIVLLCMGRHPLQRRNTIKPDIGKLPKSIVENIPLVMYIPPPPESFSHTLGKVSLSMTTSDSVPQPEPPQPKQRFKFIRRLTSFHNIRIGDRPTSLDDEDVEKTAEPQTWEEHWERGKYPFVILEENRAACAICLLDFAEPKRIRGFVNAGGPSKNTSTSEPGPELEDLVSKPDAEDVVNPDAEVAESSTSHVSLVSGGGERDTIKLADAGEKSQPLRLLACGHVFHKTCLDPWLLDISGRCPVCQRIVEVPDGKHPRKG